MSKDKAIHILTVEDGRLETRIAKAHRYVAHWGQARTPPGSPRDTA